MSTLPLAAVPDARPALVEQLSVPALVGLALIPGALVTLAYVALAPVVEQGGFPPVAALLAAIALVMVPLEVGIVLWAGRGHSSPLTAAIPYRRPIPRRKWLWLVPVLIVLAFLGFGLHQMIEPQLISSLFGWLPTWFVSPIETDRIALYSSTAWVITLAAYFALNGFLGPIAEELYFRGYLLPRMERFGRWSWLVNVTLFSIYHFWSPWQFAARILGIGPTVYAVRRTQNIYLGMVVHCTLNVIAVSIVALLVASKL